MFLPAGAAMAQDRLAPGTYRWLNEAPWTGPIYMVISIQEQQVHVYDGDRLIAVAAVSTGKKGHGTPRGDFPILQKQRYHRSNLYSNAPMPFMQRLTWGGIALHAGHDPGYPASHGCIRMPYAFAQKLFAITRIGTLVSVTANRLAPALMVDTLVLADPGAAIVTFAPQIGPPPRQPVARQSLPPLPRDENGDVPLLEIDPGIFAPRLSRP